MVAHPERSPHSNKAVLQAAQTAPSPGWTWSSTILRHDAWSRDGRPRSPRSAGCERELRRASGGKPGAEADLEACWAATSGENTREHHDHVANCPTCQRG